MRIRQIKSITADVGHLIRLSREYQHSIYPAESINQEDPARLLDENIYFIGAYNDQDLLGIGAVKICRHDIEYGEIKNLYVNPAHRGVGVSRVIMKSLEQFLVDYPVTTCRLETGVSQPQSIGLYHSLGYLDRDAYGNYAHDPLSIFMEKLLS